MTRADIADLLGWVNPKDSDLFDRIERIVRLAEAAEREVCAKLCETEFCGDDVAYYVAAAIRARDEQ